MHKRITFVNDREVRVERIPGNIVDYRAIPMASGVRSDWRKMGNLQDANMVDRQGIEAHNEVTSCFLDTGNFEALQDTSAVPFAGKKMRYSSHGNPTPCTVLKKKPLPSRPEAWLIDCEFSGARLVDACFLLPLVDPKPEVRQYEPWEAAKHLGRCFNWKCWDPQGDGRPIVSVKADGVYDDAGHLWTFKRFAEECVWVDGGSPCGMEV
jgi:hypothetical protein